MRLLLKPKFNCFLLYSPYLRDQCGGKRNVALLRKLATYEDGRLMSKDPSPCPGEAGGLKGGGAGSGERAMCRKRLPDSSISREMRLLRVFQ